MPDISLPALLKKHWGFDAFRPGQEGIITSVLQKKDTLALLPTGGGKSLCYTLPALMLDGTCLVVSPLIALMQDQVAALQARGIPATAIHSGMKAKAVRQELEKLADGEYRLLFVSPERLQTTQFKELLQLMRVSFIAVDEAHCVSQWGHDFRPEYLEIAALRPMLPNSPVLALTASATVRVEADIIQHLRLRDAAIFRASFERKNIFYSIRYSENKSGDAASAIRENTGSAIIYCRTRRSAESSAKALQDAGLTALAYHAGLSGERRTEVQNSWMENRVQTICATTAFGMGIDKGDVSLVLHTDAPEDMESYYQETGRAGRNGALSKALLFYNKSDLKRLGESTAMQYPPPDFLRKVYQSVMEYLQIPAGTELQRYFPFDLPEFCKRFSLPQTSAAHAMRLLARDGLWTMNDSAWHPPKVQFVADRHSIDAFLRHHRKAEPVALALLRLYNGIYQYPATINYAALAKKAKVHKDDVLRWLRYLDHAGIIAFDEPEDGPQLYFHHYRVHTGHLQINWERINRLRAEHQLRTDLMLGFLKNTGICRNQLLLKYFGEDVPATCGHCDVCSAKKPVAPIPELKRRLLEKLHGIATITAAALLSHFPENERAQATQALRQLADERLIALAPDTTISLRT